MSVPVECPENVWTKIVDSELAAKVRVTLTDPSKYYFDIVAAGAPPPDPEIITGSILSVFGKDFQGRDPIDVWIYAFDRAGRVDVDLDPPFTDVNKQDQHTPGVIQKFNQVHDSTTLAQDVVIPDHDTFVYDIVVANATGIVIGSHIILFNPILLRFTTFTALGVNGTTITLDSPIDVEYTTGTFVDVAITDMSVDGSTTPQVFGLRGTGVIPGVEIKVDITRIIISCLTTNAVDLSKFGDIAGGLLRGLALRFRNGDVFNIFNVKTNGDLDGITMDWQPYDAQNLQQGQHGFTCRLTFNGDDKMGIVQRLAAGEDIEFIVQDNLLTILRLIIRGEGHIVE